MTATNIAIQQAGNLANKFGVSGDPQELVATLKQTAFKGQVSDAQFTALMIVAGQYGLNPFTNEIYAFPSKGSIVPVVGVDGWARIINGNSQFDGMEFQQDADSCTCKVYRKDRSHPIVVTEFMDECRRDTQPWKSHPRRMLRHKTMIQAARLAFGFAGIFDEDEAERVKAAKDGVNIDSVNATTGDHNSPERDTLIEEAKAVAEKGNIDALRSHFQSLTKEQRKILGAQEMAFWGEHCTKVGENIIDAEIVEEKGDATTN